jgi:excisionase family DNA binding protein
MGRAEFEHYDEISDKGERAEFDTWWQRNAQKYADKNPDHHARFETFYAENPTAPITDAPKIAPPTKRTPQAVTNAHKPTNAPKPTDKPKEKQTTPKQAKNRREKIEDYPDAMTLEDVAEFLDVSTRTVYRMMDDGENFGARKVVKRWRVVRRDFQTWWERTGI